MAKTLPKLNINPLDDLFTTEEQRIDAQLEKVVKIPISEISDFKDHPFHVRMDEDMVKLIDSVQQNGILMPSLVRPNKDGTGYEMISGHRRKYACQQNGIQVIDAIVRDLDDDQATILMVDSNIQRENILPTERGFAYKMRLEAMKHQGKRTDLTSGQLVQKLGKTSIEQLSHEVGENYKQIQRYIRLTYLIEPLRDMVDGLDEDGFTMALNPAYEISFLTEVEQNDLVKTIEDTFATPSLAQAQEMKRKSQSGQLTKDIMFAMLSMEKPNQKTKFTIKSEKINKYFPRSYTDSEKEAVILKLLSEWAKKKERNQSR